MITSEDIERFSEWEHKEHKSPQEMVEEYHQKAGLHINAKYDVMGNIDIINLRKTLIKEEALEVIEATEPEHLLKELADLVYVAYGFAVTFGWNLDEAVGRVHENNVGRMKQPDGTIKYRSDGKILKNEAYPKVDLSDLI